MKLLFAGDLCVSYFEALPTIDEMHYMFNGIKPIFEDADFSVLNLECVLYDGDSKPIDKSGPNLKGNPAFIECLNYLNVDVTGLANNHIGDYGDEATFETISLLNKNKIASIGAGKNIEEAYLPYIFEKDGIRVAVIACCENEFGIADETRAGAAGFNLSRVTKAIKSAKEKADKAVFYFHGGNEFDPFPSPQKTELYRLIIDIGADAVIAMHTHCPQGYEIYNGKPIIYSMGNFFFPKKESTDNSDKTNSWYFGYLTELSITKEEISLEIKPYRFGSLGKPIELLTGIERERFMKYLSEISTPISNSEKIKYYFNIWSTIMGLVYAPYLNYSKDMITGETTAELCALKNNFSCEAHNELLRNTLDLCYYNQIEKYSALQKEITKYQHIEI